MAKSSGKRTGSSRGARRSGRRRDAPELEDIGAKPAKRAKAKVRHEERMQTREWIKQGDRRQRILELFLQNIPPKEIAKAMDMHVSSVLQHLQAIEAERREALASTLEEKRSVQLVKMAYLRAWVVEQMRRSAEDAVTKIKRVEKAPLGQKDAEQPGSLYDCEPVIVKEVSERKRVGQSGSAALGKLFLDGVAAENKLLGIDAGLADGQIEKMLVDWDRLHAPVPTSSPEQEQPASASSRSDEDPIEARIQAAAEEGP